MCIESKNGPGYMKNRVRRKQMFVSLSLGDVYRTDLDGRQYAVWVFCRWEASTYCCKKVKMRSSNSARRGRDYAQVMIALPCNLVSSRMNLTASLTSSWVFRCVSIKVVSVAEAFRSMRTTVLYALNSSLEACCCVLPSSTE